MVKRALVATLVAACSGAPARPAPPAFDPAPVIIAGTFEDGRGPDGNTVILDAPRGLIVVDTGRHRAHQDKLLAHARAAGKPIAVIINTHWHLDHTGGNAELRAVYPAAELVATTAIEGALVGFFPRGRASTDALLASGKATPQQVEEIMLNRAAIDDPANLRPSRPLTASAKLDLAGRTLDLRVAPFAATEADLWIYDEPTQTVIAGDLVVAAVPFFDSACADGWRAALAAIAATPFERLVPGHGEPMTRAAFTTWHAAFTNLVDCAAAPDRPTAACVAGWRRDAAPFIPATPNVDEYVAYYVDQILRSAEARDRFCKPLRAE